MELAERLGTILKEQYGIESDKDLLEAIEEEPGPDLGIFVVPIGGIENAS